MARDRMFQAILPLRGKSSMLREAMMPALYKNNEIASLIVALGLGTKGEAVDGLRYGKVLVMPSLRSWVLRSNAEYGDTVSCHSQHLPASPET